MNRFLTIASTSFIITGLALVPVASFAQSGNEAPKAPATTVTQSATTASAQAGAKPTADAKMMTDKAAKPAGVTTATPSKSVANDGKAPVTGKPEMHGSNAALLHHSDTAPAATPKS
jgi:hypothetical protein